MNLLHFCCLNLIFAISPFDFFVLPTSALNDSEDSRIIEVSCQCSGVAAKLQLPSNFSGVIYSLGNFFHPSCRYDTKPVPTKTNFSFFLPTNDCDIHLEELYGYIHFSTVIVLQKYSFAETAWDELHNVSCKIPQKDAKKIVLDTSSYRFLKNNLELCMDFKIDTDIYGAKDQIEEFYIGDDVLMVIELKDDGQYKDLYVESCWAYEGETAEESKYVLKIFDSNICQSSDWITHFNTTSGISNVSNIITYASFKAFKFPSTENLQISCSVSVCRQDCLKSNCNISADAEYTNNFHSRKLKKRSVPVSVSRKPPNERFRLMKATIEALKASLLKKRNGRSEDVENISKRKMQPVNTDLPESDEVILITSTDRDYFDLKTMVDISTIDSTETYSEPLEEIVEEISNDIYNFNLTMRLVVLSDRDVNFPYLPDASNFKSNCVPRLRFTLMTSMLCFILFCLILTCIALVLYLRKEKKKNSIDHFLLYNFY